MAENTISEIPARRRSRRTGVLVVVVLVLLASGVYAAVYALDARLYVSTDNAQVDGDKIAINAPTSGYLTGWTARQGAQLNTGEVVGRIKVNGGFVQPQQAIRAPGNGTVAVDNGVEGVYVTAGTELAVAYDDAKLYVTARVDETDVDAVHPGEYVEFTVDAFPGADFTGVVREVQGGAAGEANSSGNFQKVTQVIPVTISIDDARGLALVPGMNVTARIRRDG
jgi:multidrug resistance efflux pump